MQWSLSALGLFERCKFAYKCRYILREPDRRKPGGPAQRGIDTHKEIEENLLHGHPLSFELERKWGSAFREIKQYEIQIEHKISLTPEWTIDPNYKEAWLRMVLDLKAKKPSGYTVYDWKTGKEYPEHYEQKQLYCNGILAEHPEVTNISAVHVYLDLGKQTKRDYHRDQLLASRAQWDSRVKKLAHYLESPDMGQWIPEPNFLCRWCAYSRGNGGPCKF